MFHLPGFLKNCLLAYGLIIGGLLSLQFVENTNDKEVSTDIYKESFNFIKSAGFDTLPQTQFWRTLIQLSSDTLLINISSNRQIIDTFSTQEWGNISSTQRAKILDDYREKYCVNNKDKLFITLGKKHFYNHANITHLTKKGMQIFKQNNVDPFYALAILLIESPSKMQRSKSGAHGHFQIMKGVAKQMGLKVNKYKDERKIFDKSAFAAAKLIKTICEPGANKILTSNNLEIKKDELWYKLLVLHIYHAGGYNVGKAIKAIPNKFADNRLITNLWQTQAGRFKNQSQNYSQIALAAILEFEENVFLNKNSN